MALGGAKAGERVLGVRVPGRRRVQIRSRDLASAAKDIGRFSEQLGAVAGGLRRTHEALDGNGHVRRSPVEVVLQALTARS